MNSKTLCITFVALLLLIYLLYPGRFATAFYEVIKQEDILSNLHTSVVEKIDKPLCNLDFLSNNVMLFPNLSVNHHALHLLSASLNIKKGGWWQPKHCHPQYKIALIVPYRDRKTHLDIFLMHMHYFLQNQNIAYHIIVVEQVPKRPFNRGKLFNVGFVVTKKIYSVDCFIFHDVDLIPQKLSNIYACMKQPRHMSSSVNTFRYNLLYKKLFGGAISVLDDQFYSANGFSNVFYGWGSEDDDFYNRIQNRGLEVCRFEPHVARYYMLPHVKQKPSQDRFLKLASSSNLYDSDGLNNLNYILIDTKYEELYTWLLVDL